jgi:hypothetical protein
MSRNFNTVVQQLPLRRTGRSVMVVRVGAGGSGWPRPGHGWLSQMGAALLERRYGPPRPFFEEVAWERSRRPPIGCGRLVAQADRFFEVQIAGMALDSPAFQRFVRD